MPKPWNWPEQEKHTKLWGMGTSPFILGSYYRMLSFCVLSCLPDLLPSGADIVFLSFVLPSWTQHDCLLCFSTPYQGLLVLVSAWYPCFAAVYALALMCWALCASQSGDNGANTVLGVQVMWAWVESWPSHLLCDLSQLTSCHWVCVLISTIRTACVSSHYCGIKRWRGKVLWRLWT